MNRTGGPFRKPWFLETWNLGILGCPGSEISEIHSTDSVTVLQHFTPVLDLGVLKLDGFLLAFVNPATQDGEQQLPRLGNKVH
jgi:hypothetical protein